VTASKGGHERGLVRTGKPQGLNYWRHSSGKLPSTKPFARPELLVTGEALLPDMPYSPPPATLLVRDTGLPQDSSVTNYRARPSVCWKATSSDACSSLLVGECLPSLAPPRS
jgi:hypothetical protein